MQRTPAGIYFHIPFCKQSCNYCNFFFTTSKNNRKETIHAMMEELDMRKDFLDDTIIESIYFGGGTPSLLSPDQIELFIDKTYKLFEISDEVEICLEVNPDDLSDSYIVRICQSKINRLSIGIQSFIDEELHWMNRAHNAAQSHNVLHKLTQLGFDNISIDLIFGLPCSSLKKWKQNLQYFLDFNLSHISCYALTVEDKTLLNKQIKKGILKAPQEEDFVRQFYMAHDFLTEHGYTHYEISNYAKASKISKHNSSYWKNHQYLGIGPSAHSFDKRNRYWNISHIAKYIQGIRKGEIVYQQELLDSKDKYNEWIMCSLRKIEGCNLDFLKTEFSAYESYFYKQLQKIPSQYIENEKNFVRLSKEGMIMANFCTSELFYV